MEKNNKIHEAKITTITIVRKSRKEKNKLWLPIQEWKNCYG